MSGRGKGVGIINFKKEEKKRDFKFPSSKRRFCALNTLRSDFFLKGGLW